MADSRAALRAAIDAREKAKTAKDEAASALKRADAVLAANRTEQERATTALGKAEADHAKVIAKAIRAGKSADVAVTSSIRAAQAVLTDIASRTRMAQAARDQIADELAEADRKATEAEATVVNAATDVVVGEVEHAAEPLDALLVQLCAIDDLVFGVGWLRDTDGIRPRELPSKLLQVIHRLRPLREMLDQARPQRTILSGSPEEMAAGRLESYRRALMIDPETKLSEVPTPEINKAPPPQGNAIVASRIAAATKVGAASGVAA